MRFSTGPKPVWIHCEEDGSPRIDTQEPETSYGSNVDTSHHGRGGASSALVDCQRRASAVAADSGRRRTPRSLTTSKAGGPITTRGRVWRVPSRGGRHRNIRPDPYGPAPSLLPVTSFPGRQPRIGGGVVATRSRPWCPISTPKVLKSGTQRLPRAPEINQRRRGTSSTPEDAGRGVDEGGPIKLGHDGRDLILRD
jgi:hypothetical protein